jgi:4'-phosphopantetheinyl transferase
MPPGRLDFSYLVHGKPDLVPESNAINLKFNLSHSGRLALIAVTVGAEVGIDIELICDSFGGINIAKRFFSPREVEVLCTIPASRQADAFFNCWTRKEAYIKARGEGLEIPLDSFDVAFVPGEKPALLSVRFDPREVSRWSLYDLQVDENYKAALAVEGKPSRVLFWEWNGSVVL